MLRTPKGFSESNQKADEGKYLQLALSTNVYGDTAMHSGFILIIFWISATFIACYMGRIDAVKQLLPVAGSTILNMVNW